MARPDWRNQPRVEPIDLPSRWSQTFLRHGDRCMRSAYLYLKHGSAPANHLDRGTALHVFAEQVPWTLLQSAQMDQEGAVPGSAEPAPAVLEADVAETMMNVVLAEHPELAVTIDDADHLREMVYHLAGDERGRDGKRRPDGRHYPVGFDWDPTAVVAVERMWVLELDGVRLVGKIDVAWLLASMVLRVRDYKTSLAIPKVEEFAGGFQLKFYGALMLFGQPLNEQTGELEPGIGDGINWVDVGEVYPRYTRRDDGTVMDRTVTFSRTELRKFVDEDLTRLVRRMKGAFETWEFPAARGDAQCSQCPASAECPLPSVLRPHAGEINTIEQAEEALTWAEMTAAKVSATRAEAKAFARAHGVTVPCGTDTEYAFVVDEKWSTRWEDLEEGVEKARLFGQPFALSEVRRRSASTSFKKRKREVA